jgi:hypothetical protein
VGQVPGRCSKLKNLLKQGAHYFSSVTRAEAHVGRGQSQVESTTVFAGQVSGVPTDAQFDRANSLVVRSLRQSRLLDVWLTHVRQSGALPAIADFSAMRAYPEPGELTTFRVAPNGGDARYFVVRESTAFRSFFGSSSEGRFLDEAISAKKLRVARVSLDECVRQALPVFASFAANDGQNDQIICERLALPFGNGTLVTDILSSMKTTSWSKSETMFARPGSQELKYSFRAVIDLR